MPMDKPAGVGSIDNENQVAPGYDRRHFYTWALEKNDLVKNFSQILDSNAQLGRQVLTENLQGDSFWSDRLFGQQTAAVVSQAPVNQVYTKKHW